MMALTDPDTGKRLIKCLFWVNGDVYPDCVSDSKELRSIINELMGWPKDDFSPIEDELQ